MKHTGKSPRRGSVIVEFAICTPFLVLLFLGAWHYGYAFSVYNSVEQAVRAGGRFAAMQTYSAVEGAPPDEAFLTGVRNMVVYGDAAGGETPIVPGLTTDMVFTEVTFENGIPAIVRVWVDGYQLPGLFSQIVLHGKPSVRFSFTGGHAPPVE